MVGVSAGLFVQYRYCLCFLMERSHFTSFHPASTHSTTETNWRGTVLCFLYVLNRHNIVVSCCCFLLSWYITYCTNIFRSMPMQYDCKMRRHRQHTFTWKRSSCLRGDIKLQYELAQILSILSVTLLVRNMSHLCHTLSASNDRNTNWKKQHNIVASWQWPSPSITEAWCRISIKERNGRVFDSYFLH